MLTSYLRMSLVLLYLLAFTVPSHAQAAPNEAAIQPYPGAPLCPTHNDKQFHGLWDYERGCHYDHTHNDDPAPANAIFGPAGAALGGQAISYPWMTQNENDMHGHPGYKYYVNLNPQPTCAAEGYAYLGSVNCVSAFRIQYHDAGGNAHMVKRFHSYYLEAQIKKGSTVGTIQTGGWADFGCLHESYKENFLPLPGIDPVQANGATACGPGGQNINADPYRAVADPWSKIQGRTSGDNKWIWTAHNRYGYNNLAYFFFRTLDSWGSIDPADPYKEHLLCPDFRCKFNNSEHHVFNVYVMIPASLDTDKDGIVNYTGYTDNKGNIVQNCSTPGANCVPLRLVNVPVGTAIWSRNTSGPRPAGETIRDHDIYFNGQPSGWIQFHSHGSSPAPTATSPQTQTPVVPATATPTVMNPATPTATSTVTNPSTATPLPTFTPTPSNTSPPPNVPSGAQIVTATALQTQRGTANGSLSSLSVLKQSGTEDNPAEYVTFQPQGSSYEGYLSFNPPANIPAESVSAVSLRVNFKGTATSKQNWIWSIYDWNKKEWVKLGTASGKQSQWQLLELNIPLRKQYGSAQNEVWIQLRSNNAAGNAKIDYQVLQITSSAPASAQTILQPTATLISPTPGTSPTEAATSTPHHHP